ncbi:MAG TPA: hypothetical protein VE442_24505 [Jatrophihabitans sp.]|jgi:hypothetical protein|nr:hypothetical protein [Jatrophihabitans sp.]
MKLQILHVPDCPNAAVLTARVAMLIAGRADVTVEHCVIRTEAEAATHGMTGSPTLLIDGVDPFTEAVQPATLSCRLYADEAGAISGTPSITQLRAPLSPRRRRSSRAARLRR